MIRFASSFNRHYMNLSFWYIQKKDGLTLRASLKIRHSREGGNPALVNR